MNRSMIVGTVLGVSVAAVGASFAGYKMMSAQDYAQVVQVTPLVEQMATPRQECHDASVTRQKPNKDPNRLAGTAIGAIAGGVLGNVLGGDGSNTGAKIAGAAVGGLAGNKVQQSMQNGATTTTTENVCTTVNDVTERTVGYNVTYRIGDETKQVRMDHDPGSRIPMQDGQPLLSDADAMPHAG
jgi:uncharacterized protein YcfJ